MQVAVFVAGVIYGIYNRATARYEAAIAENAMPIIAQRHDALYSAGGGGNF